MHCMTIDVVLQFVASLKMEEAKDIHTSLRKASGIMKFVQDTLLPQVIITN